MPEETEDFIHIPVRNKNDFNEDSYKTITLSATKGIKAVIGKLKEDDGNTHVQKYLFEKSKGWTMSKAKKWIKKKKSEKETFDVGLSKTEIQLLMPIKTSKQETDVSGRLIEGYATLSSFNRNGYHVTNDAFTDTLEEFKENPVLFFMHMPWLVIGSVLELKIDDVGIFVKAQLLSEGKSQLADACWTKIEDGSLKSFSIGFLVLAYEKVCMEKDLCFFSVTEGELVELSVVSVPAVRGSYFKVVYNEQKKKKKKKENNLFLTTSIDPDTCACSMTGDEDWFWVADNIDTTTNINDYWWTDISTNNGYPVEYGFELDDNIKVTQIIDDKEKDKVKLMENETPEPPKTGPKTDVKIKIKAEVEGEDLSSTDDSNESLEAQVDELKEQFKAFADEKAKLEEQTLNLRVKKTMTLFEGVENKADIEKHLTAIAKNGGEDALTATTEIIKSVMESKVIVDDKLTQMGGEEMDKEDELSMRDFGKTVPEMVAELADKSIAPHEIKVEG